MAGEWLQLLQNSKRLTRQRHAVRTAHLHFFCQNAPLGVVEIKFFPLGMAEFARPDKDERSEPQSQSCGRISREAIDGAQQRANSFGLENCGTVIDRRCCKRTA